MIPLQKVQKSTLYVHIQYFMKGYYYILWSNNRKLGFCSEINA